MINTDYGNMYGQYLNGANRGNAKEKVSGQTKETTFYAVMNSAGDGLRPSKVKTSTVDDFIRRHPDNKYQVERMVDAGKNVLSRYGSDQVDEMSMDEYKHYIYGILDKIPFDSSQAQDTQFIDITEDGWEQMKNDPKYEAWVVGYFKIDRSVHIPFANMPGYEPSIHTEHFGASIDEHLGQSYPQSRSTGEEKDSEDWWKKRRERHEQYLEDAKKIAEKRMAAIENKSAKYSLHEGYLISVADDITYRTEMPWIGTIFPRV